MHDDEGAVPLLPGETIVSVQAVPVTPPPELPDAEIVAERITDGWTQPPIAACPPLDDSRADAHFGIYQAVFGRDALIIAGFLEPIMPASCCGHANTWRACRACTRTTRPMPTPMLRVRRAPAGPPMKFAIRRWMRVPGN